jgi:threonine synthase
LENLSYYSTNLKSKDSSFKEALLKGLAPDGGLYMPVSFPVITKDKLSRLPSLKYFEIASDILNELIGNEIGADDLLELCRDAYYFDVPIEKVYDRKYILRLDHGPTASFKDFAARLMSRLMQYFLSIGNQHLTILTATSGDTGSAVANAFYGLKNINVIILYPATEVTAMQRIALNGKFDDCQELVKKAFVDTALSRVPLSSANSINIGRLLPQSVYYFYAWSRLASSSDEKAIFSVPSGNFGNIMGGLIAKHIGLPVEKFIISTNENDEVPEFLRTGIYKSISPSVDCISSAMNVGHPSNLARIVALYGGMMDEKGKIHTQPDLKRMRNELYGVSVTDEETKATISEVFRNHRIMLEPHGAIGWRGMTDYLKHNTIPDADKKLCISLETAHPAKFPDEIRQILNIDPPLPGSLEGLEKKSENCVKLENNYEMLRDFILKHS